MTQPTDVPAGWSPNTDVLGASWTGLDPTVRAAALAASARLLWALSGRQFHVHDVTIAPYLPWPRRRWYDMRDRDRAMVGTVPGGASVTAYDGSAFGGWGWFPGQRLRLPGPVIQVAQVVVDGVVVSPSAWVVDPDGTLVRTDEQSWPLGQNVYSPRWTVRYTRGRAVPPEGNLAAGRYALELGRAMVASPACKLPARTRDVVRQGITVTLADPENLADAGLTGLPSVDAWLRAVNPGGVAEQSSAWAPAVTRHRLISVNS